MGTLHVIAPPASNMAVFLDGRKLGEVAASEHATFAVGTGRHQVHLLFDRSDRHPQFQVDVTGATWTAIVPSLPVQCFKVSAGLDPPKLIRSDEPVLLPHDANLRVESERCGSGGR